MKASLKLLSVTVIFFLLASNSFSTPLSGTYTIGSGGNYPTINSAFSDAETQGINGPVIFDLFNGTYNETITINFIPGSSTINIVTLKSQSGNPADVLINGVTFILKVYSANIIIRELSFGSSISDKIEIGGENISFINNNFLNGSIVNRNANQCFYIYISENKNIKNIHFEGFEISPSDLIDIEIINNSIHGYVDISYCTGVLIEKNSIGMGIGTVYCYDVLIEKNKIRGYLNAEGFVNNNLILGTVEKVGSSFIQNTVVGGTLTSPALINYGSFLLNNIIINPSGGNALFSYSNNNCDHNDYFNGGNNNLINYNGASYNNVMDFYNATGLDQHSNSQPVTFQTSTDLHLAGSSIGDNQLAGIPNALVPDDIDGQIRSLIHPYKGADEADFPLPVELASFTSSVTNNNVLLNWTTASELNNLGFDVERSLVNSEWSKVNFIKGHGNSNTPQNYSYTDNKLSSGKYKYRLRQIDFNGNFEYYNLSNDVEIGVPDKFSLLQNYPNPFNPTTNLEFGISELGFVSLKIYDISGKEVATLVNEVKPAGIYKVVFDGSNLSSGVYFYKLEAENFTSVKKMSLLK